MVKCSICGNDALYTYKVTPSYGIDYCQYHIPRALLGTGLVVPAEISAPVVVEDTTVVASPDATTKTKKTASSDSDASNS